MIDACGLCSRGPRRETALEYSVLTHTQVAKKLYVGGLSYDTTEDALREAFGQAGQVSTVAIIKDRVSGRSKGFGFVEFDNDAEAQAAINLWNGKELDGRQLTVNEARPMESRPPRSGGYDR